MPNFEWTQAQSSSVVTNQSGADNQRAEAIPSAVENSARAFPTN